MANQIKEYYNADQKCKEQYANGQVPKFEPGTSTITTTTEMTYQHFYEVKTISPTLPEEAKTLRAFSNSRLEGISECPTFGIVHMQRQYPQHGRAMALEAGEAMHQFFAAMRVWQLFKVSGFARPCDGYWGEDFRRATMEGGVEECQETEE